MLMLVILSAGLMTVISGTGVSNVAPVFADEDDCEDNGDESCNDQTKKIKLENDCKIVANNENDDKNDENSNSVTSSGDITCSNSIFSDDHDVDDVSNEPGEILICHRASGNPTQEQTMILDSNFG